MLGMQPSDVSRRETHHRQPQSLKPCSVLTIAAVRNLVLLYLIPSETQLSLRLRIEAAVTQLSTTSRSTRYLVISTYNREPEYKRANEETLLVSSPKKDEGVHNRQAQI